MIPGEAPPWRPVAPPAVRRRGPGLNVVLFALTCFTTTIAGAELNGVDLLSEPGRILAGLPFSISVMAILFCHEMGHYLAARHYGVDATLPYFLPCPPLGFPLIGTFGAVIRMRSPMPNRRALFDIGAAGPWAGVVVAVPATILGLYLSKVTPLDPAQGGIMLGDSILFSFLTWAVLGVDSSRVMIHLHPIGTAGWFGLFVTCMNLVPAGQLDGGHVSYAVFGAGHRFVSRATWAFLLFLGVTAVLSGVGWAGWLMWAVLLQAFGLEHPAPVDPITPPGGRRLKRAALTAVLFLLTFTPNPLSFVEPEPLPMFDGDRIPIAAPPPAPRGITIPL